MLWETGESGKDSPTPAPVDRHVLEDITQWESLTFPDLDSFDWEGEAAAALEGVDRSKVAVEFGIGNGCFERLTYLMGFEEAVIALLEEPEACCDFFDRLTDYQIQYIAKVKQYYAPDIIIYYDDVAMEQGLIMSPGVYREVIKPYHKKVISAIHDMGMFATCHSCGKAEALIEDFIENGADVWHSVQPVNDLETLIETYGDRISFAGGFNTNGPAAGESGTPEMIRDEVRRCIDRYGARGRAYILFGFFLNRDPSITARNFGIMIQEVLSCRG